jgi:hypothetical protein
LYLKQQQEEKHRLDYEQKLKALNDRELYTKHHCDTLQQHLIDQHEMELEIEITDNTMSSVYPTK